MMSISVTLEDGRSLLLPAIKQCILECGCGEERMMQVHDWRDC